MSLASDCTDVEVASLTVEVCYCCRSPPVLRFCQFSFAMLVPDCHIIRTDVVAVLDDPVLGEWIDLGHNDVAQIPMTYTNDGLMLDSLIFRSDDCLKGEVGLVLRIYCVTDPPRGLIVEGLWAITFQELDKGIASNGVAADLRTGWHVCRVDDGFYADFHGIFCLCRVCIQRDIVVQLSGYMSEQR